MQQDQRSEVMKHALFLFSIYQCPSKVTQNKVDVMLDMNSESVTIFSGHPICMGVFLNFSWFKWLAALRLALCHRNFCIYSAGIICRVWNQNDGPIPKYCLYYCFMKKAYSYYIPKCSEINKEQKYTAIWVVFLWLVRKKMSVFTVCNVKKIIKKKTNTKVT